MYYIVSIGILRVAENDYDSGAFDVTFFVGDTSAEVSINTIDDSINERNEAFRLVLKKTDDTPDLVEIVDPMNATGIIDDDDELSMFCGNVLLVSIVFSL